MNRWIRSLIATIIVVTPLSAAAVPITFDGLADLDSVTSQFPGLTFSNATVLTAGVSLNEFEFPPASGDNVVFDDFGAIEILFEAPAFSVSGLFTYFTTLTASAFDAGGGLLASTTSAFGSNLALSGDVGSTPNELLQLSSAAGISRVVFEADFFGGSFTLDNLDVIQSAVTIPEPPTWALLMMGMLLLLHSRRTRRNI